VKESWDFETTHEPARGRLRSAGAGRLRGGPIPRLGCGGLLAAAAAGAVYFLLGSEDPDSGVTRHPSPVTRHPSLGWRVGSFASRSGARGLLGRELVRGWFSRSGGGGVEFGKSGFGPTGLD